jgi:hypothetical protein
LKINRFIWLINTLSYLARPSFIEHTRWSKTSAMHYNFWWYFIFRFWFSFFYFLTSLLDPTKKCFISCLSNIYQLQPPSFLFTFFYLKPILPSSKKMSSTRFKFEIFLIVVLIAKRPEIVLNVSLNPDHQTVSWISQRIWLSQHVTFNYTLCDPNTRTQN